MADETKKTTSRSDDGGAAEVADRLAKEQEQGFHGTVVDPTPRENYSVAGVVGGKPTPETDAESFKKAQDAVYGGAATSKNQG